MTWSAALFSLGASGLGCSVATTRALDQAETEGPLPDVEPGPEAQTKAMPELVRRGGARDRPPQQIAGYRVAPFGRVPEGIHSAPRSSFAGSDAYLVRGHWYSPTPEGWVWFVDVPSRLAACRLELRRLESPATHPSEYPYPPPPVCPVP
jgi:hypothetical protein